MDKTQWMGKSVKECYEEVLLLNPKHANAWYNLGRQGGGLGKSRKECYEEALRLNPKYANAWYELGLNGGGLGTLWKILDYNSVWLL